MPRAVTEIMRKKSEDEFYLKPIEEKVISFLEKNRDKAFTLKELIKNLEKGADFDAKDELTQALVILLAIDYVRRLNILTSQKKIESYRDGQTMYYYMGRS